MRAIATLEHRSLADTVRELAEEALKMREFPEIVFVDGPTGYPSEIEARIALNRVTWG